MNRETQMLRAAKEDVRALSAPIDGRNVDPSLGLLRGEGAQQHIKEIDTARPYEERPARAESTAARDSYYGIPMLKEPTWRWYIPAYFWSGGLAGGSAVFAAVAQLKGRQLRRITEHGRVAALAGIVASAGLLIADLGVPRRFLYMLRVFRPTSPMNVGTWIVSAFGAAASGAVLLPGAAAEACGACAGVLGLPLAGYTAVLISNTAVPLWQGTRTSLPALFMASAAAAAGSTIEMLPAEKDDKETVRRIAVAGKAAELFMGFVAEREAARVPRVGRPLKHGASGALWKAAKVLTGAGLALSLLKRKPHWVSLVAGALGSAGALTLRFAIVEAGKASARDPHAAFDQQEAAAT